jgi:3-deoxy-D-manno-octulosonic-acid transferase
LSAILGRPVEALGNVKLAAAPPPMAEAERLGLAAALAGRDVWVAASTHPGEEEIAMRAHEEVREGRPGAVLILAPRHPERGDEIGAMAARRGLVVSRRSRQEPVTHDSAVLLWDTIGELALAYAVAPVAFVGGSLTPGIGGHNPVEPAQLGAAILSGPDVFNFAEAFGALFQNGGALSVTAETLGAMVVALLDDPDRRARMTAAARAAAADGGGALNTTTKRLLALLEPG